MIAHAPSIGAIIISFNWYMGKIISLIAAGKPRTNERSTCEEINCHPDQGITNWGTRSEEGCLVGRKIGRVSSNDLKSKELFVC